VAALAVVAVALQRLLVWQQLPTARVAGRPVSDPGVKKHGYSSLTHE